MDATQLHHQQRRPDWWTDSQGRVSCFNSAGQIAGGWRQQQVLFHFGNYHIYDYYSAAPVSPALCPAYCCDFLLLLASQNSIQQFAKEPASGPLLLLLLLLETHLSCSGYIHLLAVRH
jgi:hypothetical protein